MWVVVAAGFVLCVFGDGKRHLPCLRDTTEESGLGKAGKVTAAWVDFNNDGYPDLYCSGNSGTLWRNLKNGRSKIVVIWSCGRRQTPKSPVNKFLTVKEK